MVQHSAWDVITWYALFRSVFGVEGNAKDEQKPRHAFVFTMNDTHPGISITLELPERKMFSLYMSVPFAKIRTT